MDLRTRGLYHRPADPLASTKFIYTRFLVQHLAGYDGWALFYDCDFLWLGDIADLIGQIKDRYAVLCVQDDHRPSKASKMDNRTQTVNPRKNWSSMVL